MAETKITVSAQDNASRVLQQVRTSLGSVQQSAGLLTNALGLMSAVSVGGFLALAKSSIDGIDALNDLKDATGASIENLSGLEDIALRSGTSLDTVGTALVKMNGVLKDVKPGSDAAKALDSIGLSASQLQAMDPADALLKISVGFNALTDGGARARIAQELFGKSVRDVAPLLKDLGEAGKINATVTTAQAEEAEKFNKQLFALQKNATDAGRAMVSTLLPSLSDGAERFRLAYKHAGSLIDVLAMYARIDYSKGTEGNLRLIDEQIKGLEDRAKRITSEGGMRGNDKMIADLRAQAGFIQEMRQNRIEMRQNRILEDAANSETTAESMRLGLISRPSAPDPKPGKLTGKSTGKTQAQKDEEDFIKARQKMRRDDVTAQGLAVEEANDLYQKGLAENIAAHDKYLSSLAQEDIAHALANQSLAEQVQEIGLSTDAVNALRLARLDSNIATEEQNQLSRLELGVGADVLNMYERRLDLMKQQRDLTAQGQIAQAAVDTKADQDKASKDFSDTLRGDVKGALSAAFRDNNDPLGAFGDALANVVFTRTAESLADAMATQVLGGAASGGGGGFIGNLLGGLLSFDGGGGTGGGARAGGLDGKGGFLSILHPQETVLDHTRNQSAGGGGSITVHQPLVINAPNAMAGTVEHIRAMMPAYMAENKRVIEGVIQQAMARRGGRLSP